MFGDVSGSFSDPFFAFLVQESRKRGPQKQSPQSMSVSTMRGRY